MSLRISISLAGVLFFLFGTGFFLVVSGVAHESVSSTPIFTIKKSLSEKLSAKSVYVFDLQSKKELYTYNEKQVLPIASVTKLLSSALFYQYATATATTTITWSDVQTSGRSGRLIVGQKYQNSMFLFPALLESSNDAASVMQRVSPVDLVQKMNNYVQDKGLSTTAFTDPSGLDKGNVSTAKELGMLSELLYQEYPYIFDITRLKTYINHINAWMNNNPFVRDESYLGGKHGYTYEANRTAVAFFNEKLSEGGQRVVGYVILGSDTLQTDMETLRSFVQKNVVYK